MSSIDLVQFADVGVPVFGGLVYDYFLLFFLNLDLGRALHVGPAGFDVHLLHSLRNLPLLLLFFPLFALILTISLLLVKFVALLFFFLLQF